MSMQPIVMKVALFRGDFDQARSQYSLLWLMEALVRINQSHIRQFRQLAKEGKVPAPYPLLYRSGVHYEPEPGTEEWLDIVNVLDSRGGTFPGPWADCLPLSTLVLKDDYSLVPIGTLKPGDQIMGDGQWTKVLDHAVTGKKKILAFELNNGCILRCSPEHRIFKKDGSEIRAKEIKVGDMLMQPTKPFPVLDEPTSVRRTAEEYNDKSRVARAEKNIKVKTIREESPEICCDITTDTSRFYLPESDVIVHNCEDLACWRTAELREDPVKPLAAKPFAKWRRKPDGAYAYHALVLLPDGNLEDPSLVLGMGNEPEFARLQMAQRYKEGTLTPSIRFAKTPDVVVVDPDHPAGVSKDIQGAKARTGLTTGKVKPGTNIDTSVTLPPGARITDGIVRGQVSPALNFPLAKGAATSNEDGSIYSNLANERWPAVQGEFSEGLYDDVAAWGYDRASVGLDDMRRLAAYQKRMGHRRRQEIVLQGEDEVGISGMRLGRLGRMGRMGQPDLRWGDRFNIIANPRLKPR